MKKIYFVLLVVLGIFMMPESSLACSKSSQKKNCTKEITTLKKHKDNCCDKSSDHQKCKGKCKHASCICPVSCISAAVFMYPQEFANNLFPSTEERLKFFHTTANFASGFHSIWQPPKIS